MDKKDKDIAKLTKLLKHWANHNDSHKDSFLKWKEIAQSYGLSHVVDNLAKAIEMMDKSTEFLLKAESFLID